MTAITTTTTTTTTTSTPLVTSVTKSGTTQKTYTETGAAYAPRAARVAAAQPRDLTLMLSGRYEPFLRDVRGALRGRNLNYIQHTVRSALADAQRVASAAGDDKAQVQALAGLLRDDPIEGVDKITARAVVASLASLAGGTATVDIKGVSTPLKCSPKLASLASVGLAWAEALAHASASAAAEALEEAEVA